MYEPYKQHLATLRDAGKYRRLIADRQDNRDNHFDFSTNDYLGLSFNDDVINAGIIAAKKYGAGATGSRLLSGNNELYEKFEERIALDKGTEAALIFSTGFQANTSALSALLDHKVLGVRPIVFFDKLNHASLYQAVFLSAPELVRYSHNDMQHLSELLHQYKDDERPKFIVTETVFGMDGDVLLLDQTIVLAKQYSAFLYLDEAHATGMHGPSGYGISTTADLSDVQCLIMGTMSKALGCSGGYVACDQVVKDYLINKAQGFIYSTAPPPFVVGAALRAWEMIPGLDNARRVLSALSHDLRSKFIALGFNIGQSSTNIIPIILSEESDVMSIKTKLLTHNITISAIRPPTVPQNSARIRIALTTFHKEQDIEYLLQTLLTLPELL